MPLSAFSSPLVLAQGLIGAAAVGAITVAPPAEGRMTIVSLTGQSPGQIANWAIDADARIADAGPTAHSLVVTGRRDRLMAIALRNGSILLSSSSRSCGQGRPS